MHCCVIFNWYNSLIWVQHGQVHQDNIKRPSANFGSEPLIVKLKAGGVGPFAGGYGFGARSTLLGYFVRFDAGWQLDGFFKGKPQLYLGAWAGFLILH